MNNFIDYIRENLGSENFEKEFENFKTNTLNEYVETDLDSASDKNYLFSDFDNLIEILDELEYEDTDTDSKDKFLESGDEDIESSSTDIDENEINKKRLESFKKNKTSKFLRILREEQFEYGYVSESEEFIRELFKQNALATKSWLNDIYIDYYNNPEVLIGILRVIGRFDQYDISPVGETIALASLSHKNTEVIESGIRVFENWDSRENLEILQSLDIKVDWLNDYLNQVIEDLS